MFENHFGFIRRPFAAVPDAELFVPNEATQTAKEAIEYCVRSGQGIAVLTAPAGVGKTMLCQVLACELPPALHISFLPSPGSDSCLGLLQAIYFGLGHRVKKKHAGITNAEMRLELLEAVRELRVKANGIALIVDEAHLLSAEQLEEVRVLASYHDRGQPLIRPLLCGTPEFEERLLDPTLRALNQRLRCQTYLSPLTRAESEKFIQEQLARVGVRNRRIFDIEAIATIVAASDGIPRCINQLCDHSLYLTARSGESTVSGTVVNQALDDLMQLPLEYNRPLQSLTAVGEPTREAVVEFGSLDDDMVADHSPSGDSSGVVEAAGSFPEVGPESSDHTSTVETGALEGFEDSDACDILPASCSEVAGEADATTIETYDLQRSYEIDEELEAAFRRGLPDAPVLDVDSRTSTDRSDGSEADDRVAEARFDAPEVSEDLIVAGMNAIETQEASSDASKVQDGWTESGQEVGAADYLRLEEMDAEPAVCSTGLQRRDDEEELIESCVHTRNQIASMLDSLETHVSESLSQQYDVVMPEETANEVFRLADLDGEGGSPASAETVSVEEGRLGDRLSRVIRQEQGLM